MFHTAMIKINKNKNLTIFHMKNTSLSLLLMLFATTFVFAQNSNNPWLLSVGVTSISGGDVVYPSGSTLSSDDFSGSIGLPQVSLYRKVFAGLSIGGQVSLGKQSQSTEDWDFFSWHTALKYGFNNDKKFSPYLKAGVWGETSLNTGSDAYSENTDWSNFGSVGFDYSFGDKFGAYAEYSMGKIASGPEADYGLMSVGVSYAFGSGDRDKDGVSDKKDKCPDVPGLKEFEGCPDTDEDGIPDNEDDCPEEAGPAENKGCPDTDGDGVLDKDDTCPEVAGLAELNGCPDADEDGVADQDDECPEVAGPEDNKGCPWPDTDEDGVLDKDDECPEEAGTGANGCPEVSKEVIEALNDAGLNILFAGDSYRIMGAKTLKAFESVKAILDENTEGVVLIQGYASQDGSEEYNLNLSRKRAEAVRDRLIELGVNAARLEVEAFGENMPVGDNSTREGRAQSRRVEFKSKKQ